MNSESIDEHVQYFKEKYLEPEIFNREKIENIYEIMLQGSRCAIGEIIVHYSINGVKKFYMYNNIMQLFNSDLPNKINYLQIDIKERSDDLAQYNRNIILSISESKSTSFLRIFGDEDWVDIKFQRIDEYINNNKTRNSKVYKYLFTDGTISILTMNIIVLFFITDSFFLIEKGFNTYLIFLVNVLIFFSILLDME